MKWVFIFLTTSILRSQTVSYHGQLQVSGTTLVNQYNQITQLRGMSFGWHCFHPRFYTKETVAWLKNDWKCTIIRAAIGIEPENKGYLAQPKLSWELVENMVEAAIQNDIYIIIDWHSHAIFQKEAIQFFTKLAQKYGDRPNLIYEIFNEPDEESWDQVKSYSDAVIETIRKYDPDNIILVGTPHWDQDIHLPANNPLKQSKNIMYTLHFYAGTHGKWLRDRAEEALNKGLPIFVSESAGMEANGDGAINLPEWKAYIEWMETKKISWLTWSISDKDESCSVLQSSASSTGNWKESDLKESGKLIKAFLKFYN